MTNAIERGTKYHATLEAFWSTYNIDPTQIYCLVTGKPIGDILPDEIFDLIQSMQDDDAESRADDLAMRLFASMRPSMRWNKMRQESLNDLRKSAPQETLCYLLNRLFAMLDRKQSYVMEHLQRIKIYQHFTKFYFDGPLADQPSDCDSVMHMLLEVDAKLGLQNLAAPFTAESIMKCQSWGTVKDLLAPWHKKMMIRWEHDQAEARFVQANPLAKSAFFASYMETKPVSVTATHKKAKQVEQEWFGNLLDTITGDKPNQIIDAAIEKMDKPAVVVQATKMPLRFGGFKK